MSLLLLLLAGAAGAGTHASSPAPAAATTSTAGSSTPGASPASSSTPGASPASASTGAALLTCPGTQPCGDTCISWAELCPSGTAPAAAPAAPTESEFCAAVPARKKAEDPVKQAVVAVCGTGSTFASPCDPNSPIVQDPAPVTPSPPCGGPPVPVPAKSGE